MPAPDADPAEPFDDAAWAAMDAYTATPGSHRDRLLAVIRAHLTALAARGLLTADPPGIDVPTVEEDARWLADRSGHPRFADGDGWQLLTEREQEILMAYRAAVSRRQNRAQAAFGREAAVRDRLLLYASSKSM